MFILKFITDFGAHLGFSVFGLLLAILGLIFTWDNKKKLIPLYITILFLFLSFIYLGQYSAIFLNLIFCYFGAVALIDLVHYKWNLDIVRDLTLIVLICGLLFTTISYTKRLSDSPPNQEITSALFELNGFTHENHIILSDTENGLWIQYFADTNTLIDIYRTNKDASVMLNSRDHVTVFDLLDKNNIDYVFLSPNMKQKLWRFDDQEGLLFLLTAEEKFNEIYSNNGYDIWDVYEK